MSTEFDGDASEADGTNPDDVFSGDTETFSEDVTIGDIDVNVDAVKGTTAPREHPFEFDTRAGTIVIAIDTGDRLRLEAIGVDAAHQILGELEQATDIAAQYERDTQDGDGGDIDIEANAEVSD